MLGGYFALAALSHRARGNARPAEFFRVNRQCLIRGWKSL
jgi:hypothetical protein